MTKHARRLAAPLLAAALIGTTAAVGALIPAPALAQAAAREPQAEAFVDTQARRALNILGSRSLSQAQKAQQFRGFVDQVVNIGSVTRFVLGKYARTITPAQYQQFAPVFRAYATNVYESRLDEYKGEQFKVTGSTRLKPGDAVVTSVITGGQQSRPRTVRWRVIRDGAGQWRLVDVEVAGVWLAQVQRDDFVATVDNAGGNINVLINQLRAQTPAAQRG